MSIELLVAGAIFALQMFGAVLLVDIFMYAEGQGDRPIALKDLPRIAPIIVTGIALYVLVHTSSEESRALNRSSPTAVTLTACAIFVVLSTAWIVPRWIRKRKARAARLDAKDGER